MRIFTRIFAIIMASLFLLLPWFNAQEVETSSYVVKNNTLVISLDSNPSTGYSWQYKIQGKGIKFESSDFVSSVTDGVVSGAPGTQKLKFVSDGEGEFVIELSYCRSWETEDPANTATVKGTTDKNGNINITSFKTK